MSVVADLVPPSIRVAKRALSGWLGGEPELRLLPRLCRRDEQALDIGANYGVYAWHMRRWSAGVTAFEPQPATADFLRRAFGDRLRVEQVALSDAEGEAALRTPRDRMLDGRATIEPSNGLPGLAATALAVRRRRLDSYDFGRVGAVKIDVEGHELAVLRGAEALLARDRPTLIVEAEDRHRPGAVDSVDRLLGGLGYRGHVLRDGRLLPFAALPATAEGSSLGAQAAALGIINFIFVARPGLLDDLLG